MFVIVFTGALGRPWTFAPLSKPQGGRVALTWTRSSEWDSDDWRKVAECRDTDPDLFFPIGTTGQAIEQIDAAKAVCFSCEAREACLEFALATNQESGVWGATSEDERRKLRKAWLAAQRRRAW
jgi:WhiB family redox-sensing transcriptional regulator